LTDTEKLPYVSRVTRALAAFLREVFNGPLCGSRIMIPTENAMVLYKTMKPGRFPESELYSTDEPALIHQTGWDRRNNLPCPFFAFDDDDDDDDLDEEDNFDDMEDDFNDDFDDDFDDDDDDDYEEEGDDYDYEDDVDYDDFD
jgi:hypothetical protein